MLHLLLTPPTKPAHKVMRGSGVHPPNIVEMSSVTVSLMGASP